MKNFFYSSLKNEKRTDTDYLTTNNLALDSIPRITNFDKLVAQYSFINKTINIPENFNYLINNHQGYKDLHSHFKNDFEEYVIYHEIGHAIHHQTLGLDNNNYIKFSNQEINSFLSRPSAEATKIDNFVHMNFTEAYSDCYASLVIYLKNNNKKLISDTFEFRKKEYISRKNDISFVFKGNSPLVGKMSMTQYANYHALNHFNQNFIKIFDKEEILDMSQRYSFSAIHDFIQLDMLRGLKDTLVDEINLNPLFAKEFSEYCNNRNQPTNTKDYLEKLDQYVKDINSEVYKKLVGRNLAKREEIKIISDSLRNNHLKYTPDSILNSLLLDNQKIEINSRFCTEPGIYTEDKIYNIIISTILENKDFSLITEEVRSKKLSQYTKNIKSMVPERVFMWIENQSNINSAQQLIQTLPLTDNQIIDEYKNTLEGEGKEKFNAVQKKNNITKLSLPDVINNDHTVADNTLYQMEKANLNILNMRDHFLNTKNTTKIANKIKL